MIVIIIKFLFATTIILSIVFLLSPKHERDELRWELFNAKWDNPILPKWVINLIAILVVFFGSPFILVDMIYEFFKPTNKK